MASISREIGTDSGNGNKPSVDFQTLCVSRTPFPDSFRVGDNTPTASYFSSPTTFLASHEHLSGYTTIRASESASEQATTLFIPSGCTAVWDMDLK
jgi:hypothetical protein